MKCAASAESDAFVQAVVLFIAVIPQIARRCDLLVWLLLRAATIAFTTRLWDIQQEKVFLMVSDSGLTKSFGKGHFTDAGQKCDAPMPCSCANHGLFSNCTPSGPLVSCIRDSTKSDCPQHSRHFGHPKDNLFGAESIPFPTNVKIGSFSQKYLFISVEICTFASAIESQ